MPDKAPVPGLAIAALILSLLFCIPFVPLIGLVLGIVALRKISAADGALAGGAVAATAIALGVFMTIANIGFVAAIAIPNFIRYQLRSRQLGGDAALQKMATMATVDANRPGKFWEGTSEWTPIELCSRGPCPLDPTAFDKDPWPLLGGTPTTNGEYFFQFHYNSDGATVRIEARADLDGDGTTSLHSISGVIDDGTPTFGSVVDETPGEY